MTTARRPRADAQRNRDRLVEAARVELDHLARGDAATGRGSGRLTFDAVAARAGVGVGTLYRHFPTREALIEAVYREELLRLVDAAPALLERQSSEAALLTWMGQYVEFIETKRPIADGIGLLVTAGTITVAETRSRLADAVATLMAPGVRSGLFRSDVAPEDVVAAMAGAVLAAVGDRPREQAERLLRLLVDGLRA